MNLKQQLNKIVDADRKTDKLEHKYITIYTKSKKFNPPLHICFSFFRIADRYSLDAFAYSGFDHFENSLYKENTPLFQFMTEFNLSAAADNPVTGLCRKWSTI